MADVLEKATALVRPTTVVVVNFASATLLRANLPVLGAYAETFPIIVVDNFSSPAEAARVHQLCVDHGYVLVPLPDNRGFGAGANAGVAAARRLGAESVVFVNPDAAVDVTVLRELRAQCAADPDTMVSPRIVDSTGDVVFDGSALDVRSGRLGARLPPPRVRGYGNPTGAAARMPWLTGACVALSVDLLDRIGGFDESYFLYWEDVDLSRRVLDAGGRLLVRHDLRVRHDEGGTQHRHGRAKSARYYYYNCRNRLIYGTAHLSRRELIGWILRTPSASTEILLRGGRRQLLRSPRPLAAAAAGSLAGVAAAGRAILRSAYRPHLGGTGFGAADHVDWASVPTPAGAPRVLVTHPGAELYGSDRMLLESVHGLVDAGAIVTVALPDHGPLVERLRSVGATVRICRMPVLRKDALRPLGFLRLLREAAAGLPAAASMIRRHGQAGVYVSTVTLPSWPLLARLMRRRVLVHVHEAEGSASLGLRRLLYAPTLAATGVICNSHHSERVMSSAFALLGRRAVVVLNAVRGPDQPVPGRRKLESPVRLLYIGRLSPRKGPQVAVAALKLLVQRGRDVTLVLLGAAFPGYEWFTAELRDAVGRAGLDNRVSFVGFSPDVWPYFAATDIVLVPSVSDEPFGNTAVEAVLAGRPLVVSETSGLTEAAAGYPSAWLVPPDQPDRLADAVEAVIDGWTDVGAAAAQAARSAADRHAPDVYRRRIALLMLGPADSAPSGIGRSCPSIS